jgi:nucleotide-binding universal stress UspA family protein
MKIVVGYDGSEAANRALERAVTLAGNDGRIIIVAAVESHAPLASPRAPISTAPRTSDGATISSRRRRSSPNVASTLTTIEAQGDPG